MLPSMAGRAISKTSAAVALALLASFVLLAIWLPWQVALRLTLSIPFLYVLPGYWITRVLLPTRDRLEMVVSSVLLSFVVVNLGIFLVEESTLRMTGTHMLLTVTIVNLLAFALFLLTRRTRVRALPQALLPANVARELHERDEEEPEDEPDTAENRERLREYSGERRPREP